MRPDFDQSDIVLLQLALTAIPDRTRELAPQLYRRYPTMVLEGICADERPLTPLPVAALTPNETHKVFTRKLR